MSKSSVRKPVLVAVVLFVLFGASILFAQLVEIQTPDWFKEHVQKRRKSVGQQTTQEFVDDLWRVIYTVSMKYELPPTYIAVVIAVESNFTNAKGAGGVLGMMQILPSTAQSIAKLLKLDVPKNGWNELLNNYELNITYGTAYLSYLFKKHGSLQKALEYYNNGKNKVIYAQTIMKQYSFYDTLHTSEMKQKAEQNLASASVTQSAEQSATSTSTMLEATSLEITKEGSSTIASTNPGPSTVNDIPVIVPPSIPPLFGTK
ncbi:transglycosylase SLT domain-containing protein [Fervidobacterium gondwanense]|uniref:transglycosylase SLT domain-containing protein n=2 Tax=Fervidobacterium gondwanense TaxID=44754 RepID=UPI00355BD827